MTTIAYTNHAAEQNKLKDRVDRVYGSLRAHSIPKKEFLPQAWETILSFLGEYRKTSLVDATLARYTNFANRGYTLVTIRLGLFPYQPTKSHILKELINLMGEDLAKQEYLIYEQMIKSSVRGYFPELAKMLEVIEEIYGMEPDNSPLLLTTPYSGYKRVTLEHPELICEEPSFWSIRKELEIFQTPIPIMGIELAC